MILIILETVGGLCVALGLFTRFFAIALRSGGPYSLDRRLGREL